MGHRRTYAIFAATLFASLLFASSAIATPPDRYSFRGANSDVVHCDGFDDNFTDVFSGTGTIYFDQGGEPDSSDRARCLSFVGHELGDGSDASRT
jgi:hypothetical protein